MQNNNYYTFVFVELHKTYASIRNGLLLGLCWIILMLDYHYIIIINNEYI